MVSTQAEKLKKHSLEVNTKIINRNSNDNGNSKVEMSFGQSSVR